MEGSYQILKIFSFQNDSMILMVKSASVKIRCRKKRWRRCAGDMAAATVGDMAVDTEEDMAAATVGGTVDHKAAMGEDFKVVMEVDIVDLKVKYSFYNYFYNLEVQNS